MTVKHTLGITAVVLTLAVTSAACGDDDDSSGSATASGNVQAYCEIAAEVDSLEGLPNDEQLDRLLETAPAEIRDDVTYLVGRLRGDINPDEVFGDPEVVERFQRTDAWEGDHCGAESEQGIGQAPEASRQIDPQAQRVDVTATEYSFAFEPPHAGAVSFVMRNQGGEAHLMSLGRLREGRTLAEAIEDEDATEWAVESGVAEPGEEAVLTIGDLQPGEYDLVCFISSADGQRHAMKGMAVQFTVE